jgi:hypothetical protein
MVMAARAVGLVQKADGMNARSAATPRNDSKQSLTAEMSWRTSKAARIDECPMASWTQGLPSTSFRLIRPPCRFFPTGDARLATKRVRESARSSYFRRK